VSVSIQLLGRPRIDGGSVPPYVFRSQKSWGLLAYLLLSDRPPFREQAAGLLFDRADDPLRALRWNLSELRHGLGPEGVLEGDPLMLALPSGSQVDVELVTRGTWSEAVHLAGLGSGLLDGLNVHGAAGFETWLLSERRRLSAASESVLHEAALGSMSEGRLEAALDFALRASAMSPLDENHHALVIRLHRRLGDEDAARSRFALVAELLDRELGVAPGRALESALIGSLRGPQTNVSAAAIEAIVEAGAAAVSAGAVDAGVESLRTAVRLADSAPESQMQVPARLVLAEALIHSLRGMDEEGLAALHAADRIAATNGDRAAMAEVRAELGYVDFLRARYDRAHLWLTDALDYADDARWIVAKASTYLGSVESDRANYAIALAHLELGASLAREIGEVRREIFAMSMLGRLHLLRGELDAASEVLDTSIALAERDRWLAHLPWPQALRGAVELARGDVPAATAILEQAFARACQLEDPCWEGLAARGLAMGAEAVGDVDRAFELLADARVRCNRMADPYVWLDAYILDAQCEVGRRHGHPDTLRWVETMRTLASRTAMREMVVRSLLHGAAMGIDGDAAGALLLAEGIDNPELDRLLAAAP
jgi:DNA-binding SARP family transcriptional activator